MSIIDEIRASMQKDAVEKVTRAQDKADMNASIDALAKRYAKERGVSEDEALEKVKSFVSRLEKGGATKKEIYDTIGFGGNMGVNDYIRRYGTDEEKKEAAKYANQNASYGEEVADFAKDVFGTGSSIGSLLGGAMALGPWGSGNIARTLATGGALKTPAWLVNALGGLGIMKGTAEATAGLANESEYINPFNKTWATGKKDIPTDKGNTVLGGANEKYKKFLAGADDVLGLIDYNPDEKKNTSKDDGNNGGTGKKDGTSDDDDDTVTFELTAMDPNYRGFGQKIIDLGLATNHGLWGPDGDVEYYNKQLDEQDARWDLGGGRKGNLKTGRKITLRRRK